MFAVDFIWGLNVIFIRFEVGAFQRQPLSRIQTACESLSVHWHAKPISFACSSTRIPGHDSPAAKHTSFQPTGLWLPPLPHTILSHSGHKVSSFPLLRNVPLPPASHPTGPSLHSSSEAWLGVALPRGTHAFPNRSCADLTNGCSQISQYHATF